MDKFNFAKIDKEQFEKFLNEDLSVKESRILLKKIDERFAYIVKEFMGAHGFKVDWFDYGNLDEDGFNEHEKGSFDIEANKEEISFFGGFIPENGNKMNIWDVDKKFPTSWLYSDFANEIQNIVEKTKQRLADEAKKLSDAKDELHKKKLEIDEAREKIVALLPKELLDFIVFVSPSELDMNRSRIKNEEKKSSAIIAKKLKQEGRDISKEYTQYKNDGGNQSFDIWVKSLK